MPELPYQVKVTKTQSRYICESRSSNGVCARGKVTSSDTTLTPFNVNVPTAFKIVDASSYNYVESADPNTYGVRPISLCKTKRYEDNFNVRVISCWRWSYLSNKPSMTHLDTFWKPGDVDIDKNLPGIYSTIAANNQNKETVNIHKIYEGSTGINQNKKTIFKCISIDNVNPYKFQTEPCWVENIPDVQQKKQFWIRPHYTFYRSSQSISDKTDCRILLIGADFVNGL
jgi:hypothetical protein